MANKKTNNKKISDEKSEYEQKLIDIARVTRVVAGGKRMRFRACVVLGDKKGRVSYGVAKGTDVTIAVSKAVEKAKKKIMRVNIINETIPFKIKEKFKAAYVLLKPAPKGTGVRAGGPVRAVLELAGIKNVVSKMLGSKNKINNVKATYNALSKLTTLSFRGQGPKNPWNNETPRLTP